ncbi:Hypothetical predicted protein, partial [Mytilus galloprovincialis]
MECVKIQLYIFLILLFLAQISRTKNNKKVKAWKAKFQASSPQEETQVQLPASNGPLNSGPSAPATSGSKTNKRTKQNAFQEKIVQLNRFSLAIDDNTEGHPCPIGMYFNETTQECKCSDNSIYIADNAQCQCIEGYKEMTLFRSYIRCYKYTDTR